MCFQTCTFAFLHASPSGSHLRGFWPSAALWGLKGAEAENSHTLKLMRVLAAVRERCELVLLSHPTYINRPAAWRLYSAPFVKLHPSLPFTHSDPHAQTLSRHPEDSKLTEVYNREESIMCCKPFYKEKAGYCEVTAWTSSGLSNLFKQ